MCYVLFLSQVLVQFEGGELVEVLQLFGMLVWGWIFCVLA